MSDKATRRRCANMEEVRREIDAIDRGLVTLLADRLHYIDEAARIKGRRDQVHDQPRIDDVLAKVTVEARRLGCDAAVVEAAFRALVEASIAHEFVAFDARTKR
jgi:isochorismate pyruvate lyase